jgi:GT2 family glycosyltransferase
LIEPASQLPDASRTPNLAAVVLNYDTPDQTVLAVRSLQSSLLPPDPIIVVDNGSPNGSRTLQRMLATSSARERESDGVNRGSAIPAGRDAWIIETGRNLGFSGGMNVGIRAALQHGAELVLLVNSDASLAPDATTLLLAAAREQPDAAILAPLVVSRAEPGRVEGAGIAYAQATGRMRNLFAGRPVSAVAPHPFQVSAVSGCVMLLPRPVLEKIGLFDEEYFFSFEDVELCLRAGAAGFRSLCVPQARASHEGSRSIGRRSTARIYFATRNHLRLASACGGNGTRRAIRAAFIVGLNTAYVLTSADAPVIAGLAAVARGARDHILGRYGPGPAA